MDDKFDRRRRGSKYTASGKLVRSFRPRLMCLEDRVVPDGGPLGPLQPPALGPISYTTNASGLPLLHGLATARTAIFLDFDGYTNGQTTYAPYDTNGVPGVFDLTEQTAILECWRQLSVYFAMFDVDVTTVQPACSTPMCWQLISNSISGGYAFVGAYPNSAPAGFDESSDAQYRESGITHETGHNFGLSHQSDYDLLQQQDKRVLKWLRYLSRSDYGRRFRTIRPQVVYRPPILSRRSGNCSRRLVHNCESDSYDSDSAGRWLSN